MRQKNEQDAYLQLAALCAHSEHCEWEMTEKMRRWELDEQQQARILQRLIKERFVDNERYARAFVKDKILYNKWGPKKVEQALWQKHISEDIRQEVLNEVDDEEYLTILRPLLQQKRKTTKASSTYELNQKLMRFALGRGFSYDLIKQCIEVEE